MAILKDCLFLCGKFKALFCSKLPNDYVLNCGGKVFTKENVKDHDLLDFVYLVFVFITVSECGVTSSCNYQFPKRFCILYAKEIES